MLLALEKSVDGYILIEDFAYNPSLYAQGMREVKKSTLAKALKRLREKGFVELLTGQELALRLTDQGKSQALRIKMRQDDEVWDGKWRLVIWDIPEKRRKARDLFRHQLKLLGFTMIQKSVWASKKDCRVVLKDYINQVGIGEWVTVMESKTIKA